MLKMTIRIVAVPIIFILFSFTQNPEGLDTTGIEVQKGKNNPQDSPSFIDNSLCLRCHASKQFTLVNPSTGQEKRQAMSGNYRIIEEKYYNSVHWTFACTDCHSYEYQTFPHALELRFEPSFICTDCHGGDETYAQYHFEEIESEYQKSVHFNIENNEFTCWKCHDPHSYVPLARRDTTSINFIVSSNQMCLECHGNFDKLHLLSDKDLAGIVEKHDWLPNQALHFKSVRCIECHSAQNQEILISHNILPKDSAISDCVKCHSSNSILMGSLYKFRTIESRKSFGFVNSTIIDNDSYVIGANRSKFMNIATILLIGLTLMAVIIHTIFRIIKANK